METTEKSTKVNISATIQAPVVKVWNYFTGPSHITQWNQASPDWHTPRAENDVRVGGQLVSRMEAKDGSMGFDFKGTYTAVEEHQRLAYTLEDGRKVEVLFTSENGKTQVNQTFEAENTHPVEMQRDGWQAILDSFKRYVEAPIVLESLHFDIKIQAGAEKVYQTMLDEKHYSTWTAAFDPSSRYSGSWEKGSKILFLGDDQDGNQQGMVARIKENIPYQFVSIEHLGMVDKGKEITSGPKVEGWAGALENYTFKEENGQTLLSIDVDTHREYKTFFMDTWPEALQKLKGICEAS